MPTIHKRKNFANEDEEKKVVAFLPTEEATLRSSDTKPETKCTHSDSIKDVTMRK